MMGLEFMDEVPFKDVYIHSLIRDEHRNIVDISKADSIERELVIIKVAADGSSRSEIIQIANVFRARIVDFAHNALIIEATGPDGKISAIIDLLKPYGILELTRTGKLAMVRSNDLSNKEEEI